MADPLSVTDLLLSHSEAKLQKLRNTMASEIERLAMEMRQVEEVLARKRRAKADAESGTNGRADELSRTTLYEYILEYGRPVKAAPLAGFLKSKGIVRRPEAIRNSLVRLEGDGKLYRNHQGFFLPVEDEFETDTSGGSEAQSRLSGLQA